MLSVLLKRYIYAQTAPEMQNKVTDFPLGRNMDGRSFPTTESY